MHQVILYTDYKSPFAYLAKDPAYRLEADCELRLDWRHYTLPIAEFFQSVETRSERNWRKVKYLYMDARRLANKRGLTVLGPQKVFDSSIAGIAMYFALDQGPEVFRGYNDRVHERFFKRDLDIEQPALIEAVLVEAGAEVAGFAEFLAGEGRARHDRIVTEAEEAGVFGVPTFVHEGELFWGTDRIDLLRERLDAA